MEEKRIRFDGGDLLTARQSIKRHDLAKQERGKRSTFPCHRGREVKRESAHKTYVS